LSEPIHFGQGLLPAVAIFVRKRIGEVLDPQAQGAERIAQLMGGVRDQGALLGQGPADGAGHRIETQRQVPKFGRAGLDRNAGLVVAAGHRLHGFIQSIDRAQHPPAERNGQQAGGYDSQQTCAGQRQPPGQDVGPRSVGRRHSDHGSHDLHALQDGGGHGDRIGAPRKDDGWGLRSATE